MMPAFDPAALQGRLSKLQSKQQLAFGLLCCERLLPNYLFFQNESGWGDVNCIRNALDYSWFYIYGQDCDTKKIESEIAVCEASAPSSDDFQSLYVTAAQDACFAACCMLDFLLDNDVDRIIQAAVYATDSVDLYVQEIEDMQPNDPQLEIKILSHDLMQRELIRQEEDLRAIEAAPKLNSEFVRQRVLAWGMDGKGNLDLA